MEQQESQSNAPDETSIELAAEEPLSLHLPWHPAFVEALQLDLKQYSDILEFIPERPLTDGPLKIDVVVIKKAKDVVIEKNIAAIFKPVNVLEYKSPNDYVSIADFYKVYGYACFYSSLENVSITDMTISFVGSHYPRELIAHLRKVRGYTVEETSPGIYTVSGDILPVQIIDSRKLSEDENLWLKGLRTALDMGTRRRIAAEIGRLGKDAPGAYSLIQSYGYPKIIEEIITMSDNALKLEQALEKVGWTAKWEARGRTLGETLGEARGKEIKAFSIAKNLINMGLPFDTVVSATQLDPEKVRSLYP